MPRRGSSRRLGTLQSPTTKQTQSRRTPVRSTPSKDKTRSADLAFEICGLCSGNRHSYHGKASDSPVAHALSVPRRDSSRRLGTLQRQTTKQTQSRRTSMKSTTDDCRSTNDRAAGWRSGQASPGRRFGDVARVKTETTCAWASAARINAGASCPRLFVPGTDPGELPNKANSHISYAIAMTLLRICEAKKRSMLEVKRSRDRPLVGPTS